MPRQKITGDLYAKMETAYVATVEFAGGADSVRQFYAARNHTNRRMVWDVWWHAIKTIRRKEPGFRFPPGILDTHIETALKRIAKTCGVLVDIAGRPVDLGSKVAGE